MNSGYETHQIKTSFHTFVNFSYIVLDKATKSAMIVDPAWELNKIVNKLKQLNANLLAIFLTHSHYDHVNMVSPLIEKYNPTVYMSKQEIDYYNYNCSNLKALNDEETVKVGETYVTGILTPGHTAGGMCYLLQNSLFTGDTIFIEGCGICYDKGGSADKMFESIQKVKARISKDVNVYPGHSYGKTLGLTIGQISKENIYFQIDNKDTFINFRMRKNQKDIFNFNKNNNGD